MAIMTALISRLGAEQIAAQLALAGPGFLWILALHAAAMIVTALPWYALLPRDIRPTVGGAITSRFVASGASAVIPLVGFAGELARLLWLPKGERAPGVAAIVVDRLMYGAAGVAILGAGLVGLSHVPSLPADYARGAVVGIAVLLVATVGGVLLASRFKLGARIQRLVQRARQRLRKKVDHDSEFGEAVDGHIQQMLRARSRGPWIALALHVVARSAMAAEVLVGFHLLGVPLHWDEALVFAALPIILSVAGALVPSQIGVHEGAQALIAASFGISTTAAVAVVLLLRLRQLAGAAIVGVVLLARRGSLRPATASAADALAPATASS
jgi:hypothetical protein